MRVWSSLCQIKSVSSSMMRRPTVVMVRGRPFWSISPGFALFRVSTSIVVLAWSSPLSSIEPGNCNTKHRKLGNASPSPWECDVIVGYGSPTPNGTLTHRGDSFNMKHPVHGTSPSVPLLRACSTHAVFRGYYIQMSKASQIPSVIIKLSFPFEKLAQLI